MGKGGDKEVITEEEGIDGWMVQHGPLGRAPLYCMAVISSEITLAHDFSFEGEKSISMKGGKKAVTGFQSMKNKFRDLLAFMLVMLRLHPVRLSSLGTSREELPLEDALLPTV